MTEKLRVTEIVTRSANNDNPIVLHFQNGKLNPDAKDIIFFKAKDNQQINKKLAVVATKSSVYTGCINDSMSSAMVNNFLVIKNKVSGKVRLVQVDNASLINDVLNKSTTTLDPLTDETAHNMMVRNFGGRQANRNLERKQKSKVNVDIVKEQLDKTLNESNIAKEDLIVKIDESSINQLRPPFDAEAKKIEDVYKLSDIIPNVLMERMDDEAKAVLNANVGDLPIASDYIKDRLRQIKDSSIPDSISNLEKVKVLIYMDALQNLMKSKERNMLNVNISNITERVETDIRTRFAEPNMSKMKLSRFTKEKAICYYLTLALLISPKYEVPLETLSTELSLAKPTILKYGQIINAKQAHTFLKLGLPSKIKLTRVFSVRKK